MSSYRNSEVLLKEMRKFSRLPREFTLVLESLKGNTSRSSVRISSDSKTSIYIDRRPGLLLREELKVFHKIPRNFVIELLDHLWARSSGYILIEGLEIFSLKALKSSHRKPRPGGFLTEDLTIFTQKTWNYSDLRILFS